MRAWLCLGWALVVAAAWGCGPSEVSLQPDSPEDDGDGPIFVRYDARPRPDASPIDARAPSDGGAAPDASVPDEPDAEPGPTVTFDPAEVFVARGGTATVRISLPQAAADDTIISLATTGSAAAVPTSIVITAGHTSADVTVTGLTIGQVSVTAEGERALVHVVPPIAALAPAGPTDLAFGSDLTFTITLEAGSDIGVPVSLVIDDPTVLSGAASVTIPAHQASLDVTVHGAGLGVTGLHALIGDSGAAATVRVNGLFMSEILYDAVGNDGGLEWIELYNTTDQDIVLDGMHLDVALMPPFAVVAEFVNTIHAGECAAVPLPPDPMDATLGILGNGNNGDGIRLVLANGAVIDEVIYGDSNLDQIPDENNDVPDSPDVADVAPGSTIARDFDSPGMPWGTPALPTEGSCTNF